MWWREGKNKKAENWRVWRNCKKNTITYLSEKSFSNKDDEEDTRIYSIKKSTLVMCRKEEKNA